MKNRIWCYWEPRRNIHDYLRLCLETWSKLGYEVVIIDDSNLSDYLLGRDLRLLRKHKDLYSLPQYADAIRVMILHKYGGIWMDLDVIIVNPENFNKIAELKSTTELLMIDEHIGWIWASKNSTIMKKWYRELVKKINFEKYKVNRDGFVRKIWRYVKKIKYQIFNEQDKMQGLAAYMNKPQIGWDYLGNSIVNSFIQNAKSNEYASLTNLWPYESFVPESKNWGKSFDKPKIYQDFWFTPITRTEKNKIINNSTIIYLHNSWTPEKYKAMNRSTFLSCDIALSEVLRVLVDDN